MRRCGKWSCRLPTTASHCNTLQHTATYCHTLQHTVSTQCVKRDPIHCNTLQHTASHCNTLQHTATYSHCNTLHHTATTHCNTPYQHNMSKGIQHTATYCNILQHTATHCHKLPHTATHHINTICQKRPRCMKRNPSKKSHQKEAKGIHQKESIKRNPSLTPVARLIVLHEHISVKSLGLSELFFGILVSEFRFTVFFPLGCGVDS